MLFKKKYNDKFFGDIRKSGDYYRSEFNIEALGLSIEVSFDSIDDSFLKSCKEVFLSLKEGYSALHEQLSIDLEKFTIDHPMMKFMANKYSLSLEQVMFTEEKVTTSWGFSTSDDEEFFEVTVLHENDGMTIMGISD